MRNVLVSAGSIGPNFVRSARSVDPSVHVGTLVALTDAGSVEDLADLRDPDRPIFVQVELCDQALGEEVLRREGIDTVVNLVAETPVDRSTAAGRATTGPSAPRMSDDGGTGAVTQDGDCATEGSFWHSDVGWLRSSRGMN